jgi:hypothetical protein
MKVALNTLDDGVWVNLGLDRLHQGVNPGVEVDLDLFANGNVGGNDPWTRTR